MLPFILRLALFFIPLLAHANDTSFGGSGSLPVPINQHNIAMLNEHIVITGENINAMGGQWIYTCDFTFKNFSDQAQSIQMGFPVPIYDSEESPIPEGMDVKLGSPLVQNFEVKINGQPIVATYSKITPIPDKGLNYDEAYLWQATIAPNSTVQINHHYTSGVTINSMGQNNVYYVLKTGVLWKDQTIGSTAIEVKPNTPTKLCSEIDTANAEYLKPMPAGMTVVSDGKMRIYKWQLNNFHPTEDLDLCLMTGQNFVRYKVVYPIINQQSGDQTVDVKKMSVEQRRLLRNSIYAMHGRTFTDPKLQQYFDQQWWYQANPQYQDNLLSADDKQAIALLS